MSNTGEAKAARPLDEGMQALVDTMIKQDADSLMFATRLAVAMLPTDKVERRRVKSRLLRQRKRIAGGQKRLALMLIDDLIRRLR
jgi:hypothetical protein